MLGQHRRRRNRNSSKKTIKSVDGEYRLSGLQRGDKAEVIFNDSNGQIRRRLMDMGLIRGVKFTVIRKAPLGDPIEIEIDGFYLSLRLEEADLVIVRLLDN